MGRTRTGSARGIGRASLLVVAVVVTGLTGAAPSTESWDAVYLAGAKVGSIHTFIEPVKDKDRSLLRVRVDLELKYKRLKDTVAMRMLYGTIETTDGEVLRLDTRITTSDNEIRIHGDAVDGKMKLVIDGGGQRQEKVIPWGNDVRGPYAAEQSLSREPMKPGDSRTLKMYMPDLNRVCDVTLTAKQNEEIKLGGNSNRSLLKVEQTTALDGKPRPEFDVTLWVDSGGQVLKSKTDNLGGMVTYRTTKAAALAPSDSGAQFDQIANSVIRLPRKINRPEATRSVRYRITMTDDEPAKLLPNDRRQAVSAGSNKNEAILDVKTAGPEVGTPEASPADDVYVRPNAMITSRDPEVIDLARKAVGNVTDPWAKAVRIEKWVYQNLKNKNFEIGFAPASEVARHLTGDCTEHGVLVAAMCRAANIPARVVVGLVYADNLGGFGFHLWNEVFVNNRWVAIDSSFDEDAVDAVHIKLADASLDGVSPFEAFLPIVRVLGKTKIEALEIR